MSIYKTGLTKAQRKEVFSGNPVPEEWMPDGTWRPGADYICLVLKNSVVPGAFKFVSAGKNLVRAIPVMPIEPLARSDVFKARSEREEADERLGRQKLIAQVEQELLKEKGKAAVTVDREQLQAVCDKLETLLLEDDAEAVDVLEANAALLEAAFPSHYPKIDNSIRTYNFEAALIALRSATGTSA